VRTTHDSPSRVDWADYEPLSDHDEQALEAIRRQLDMEFPHYSGPDVVAPARTLPAARRRGRTARVLGLLLVCAGGFAATAVFITVVHTLETRPHQMLERSPAVDRNSPPTAPASMTPVVTARSPATTVRTDTGMKPPDIQRPSATVPRVQQASTKPLVLQRAKSAPVSPGPDVIRVTETTPPRRKTSAAAVIAPVAAPPAPAPSMAAPPAPAPAIAPPPVATSPLPAPPVAAKPAAAQPTVEQVVRTAPAPPPPPERALVDRARDTLVEFASEHVRTAWEAVKARVVRSPGEIAQPSRGGTDAP
jgi:hypothetical protein